MRVGDLKIAGVSEYSIVHVRRGDADLLPRPDLILEYGDRVGVMARREDRGAVRAHFGDSIKGTAEFSYVSLGVGMALGVLLGILPIPVPGLGTLSLGVAGGPLVVALILSRFGRTGNWVWTMPVSANVTLRNFGLTIFLAQIGLVSGPKFIATVQQLGPLFLALGAAIILAPMLVNMLVGHFVLKLRFDDLLGAAAGGVGGNPAILAFGSKLVPTDRTDITYATVFPAATITKIVLVQVMLAMMGKLMKTLDIALKISLVLFMVGNLLDMGLLLKVQAALGALRNVRFVSLACCGASSCCRVWPISSPWSSRWSLRMPSGSSCWPWRRVRRSSRRWWTRPAGTWPTPPPSCCWHRWPRWSTCLSRFRCWSRGSPPAPGPSRSPCCSSCSCPWRSGWQSSPARRPSRPGCSRSSRR